MFLIVLIGIAGIIHVQDFTVGDLNYSVNEDGMSVTVTGHVDGQGATGELSIPETVTYNGNDYTITIIGHGAFDNMTGLTGSLIIPNTVVSIENKAFYRCTGLDGDLVIGDAVTDIGYGAFQWCTGFNGTLTIGNSVTNIKEMAFTNCAGFTGSLNLPNSLKRIERYAFKYCSGFTGHLVIPNSTTFIGYYAFQNCSGFDETLVIGESVSFIGSKAFRDYSSFTKAISLATTPPILKENVFSHFGCNTVTVPCGCAPAYNNTYWNGSYGFGGFAIILEDCESIIESEDNIVSIFPNPTSGSIKIEAENIQSVSIYNMLGEKVYENVVNENVFNYNFSANESGVYLIRIETPRGVATKKVTVR